MVQGLPLPLLKICDFGYSKAHFMSAPKSKVRWASAAVVSCVATNMLTRAGPDNSVGTWCSDTEVGSLPAPACRCLHRWRRHAVAHPGHLGRVLYVETYSQVGTLAYMAPEIIKATGKYDGKKADIWCVRHRHVHPALVPHLAPGVVASLTDACPAVRAIAAE